MSVKNCVVVDYGLGNVFSVMQALSDFPVQVTLSADPAKIRAADQVILPGVGAFGRAADRLRSLHLDDPILNFIATGRPFLGICVGMQLLFDQGLEFGVHSGLGLIRGQVEKISIADEVGHPMRVPLIGWHPLAPPDEDPARWTGTPFAEIADDSAFYFVHSYSARNVEDGAILANTRHHGHDVVAAVRKGNITGVQFHPERSGQRGRDFLSAFLNS